ncbi:hypothetical protein F5Y15DRAFT_388216 [Xylariaceae sp. FL0016]|nr:hypothetical protein F5Y15DRAFT_388216 [Xylariaceae sp. FL0016]
MMADEGSVPDARLRKIHPFFSVPKSANKAISSNPVAPVTPDPSCSPASDRSGPDAIDNANDANDENLTCEPKRKRRKTDSATEIQQDISKGARAKRQSRVSTGASIASHLASKAGDGAHEIDELQNDEPQIPRPKHSLQSYTVLSLLQNDGNSASSVKSAKDANQSESSTTDQKPVKVLKFNPKTGTIGSPPKPRNNAPPAEKNATTTASGSNRGRKPKSRLVFINYGSDQLSRRRIGQRINDIFQVPNHDTAVAISSSNQELPTNDITRPSTPQKSMPMKPATPGKVDTPKKTSTPKKTTTPRKATHPFFQGRKKPDDSNAEIEQQPTKQPPKRETIFTSTPCSPKHVRPPAQRFDIPPLGLRSGGLKVPGAQHPAWPWSGMVHTRDAPPATSIGMSHIPSIMSKVKKSKGHAIQLSEKESVMHQFTSNMDLDGLREEMKSFDTDTFHPIPSVVRIPQRHYESGKKLRERVLGELRTYNPANISADSHPAVVHACEMVASSLSAWDRSTCETIAWAQKYAPPSADCILQSGREAELLRNWLRTLKVQSVDTGSVEGTSKSKAVLPHKKRRKGKKLDGFVVSSDEEADELDEVSGSEDGWAPDTTKGRSKKTVIRTGTIGSKDAGRLVNAVVLSGPHGCGKTATVHAIAKELDFEIFEINSGARRSGKDIIEKVGDMTRNHLVQHQKDDVRIDATEDDDEVSRDLKSGKQGMMTSFFKPQLAKKTKQPLKKPAQSFKAEANTETPHSKDGRKPSKKQKQSLILLEEVDILFEEDKNFWSTVISMISQSKRPFVMTCIDETMVPLQSLNLHGIFRFTAPPKNAAVDLLLLIAANEGHALRRRPIEALYDARRHDLRASVTELNFWCQFGVGDLRGGFDWLYPRWPKGSDVDEEGHTIRVASENTYHVGMGWLNRDSVIGASSSRTVEEELQRQTWDFWGLDVLESNGKSVFETWALSTSAAMREQPIESRQSIMESLDAFSASFSDSDIYGPHMSALSNRIPLDTTVPDLPAKTKDDFIIGQPCLEVTPLYRYDNISLDISTALRRLSQLQLGAKTITNDILRPFEHLDEPSVLGMIQGHASPESQPKAAIARHDYSSAFDPIAASEKSMALGYLDPSVFDRTMNLISLDVAPYIRSIVAYDQRLQEERRSRSSLLCEGGKAGKKRMRTTRSAYSALEGGSRASTRKEKYFAADINPYIIAHTGGKDWDQLPSRFSGNQDVPRSTEQNHSGDEGMSSD